MTISQGKLRKHNHTPVFSIIIPTYNRAHLLSRAVQSVLNQTFSDFELIIVDDASPDNTAEVVEAFYDNRIIYIRPEKNGGASASRNLGVRRARGEFISFLDDDDEYLPQFLAETYRVLNDAPADIGFSWCSVRKVRDTSHGEIEVKDIMAVSNDRGSSSQTNLQAGTGFGLTIRASCFSTVGLFDETLSNMEDSDFLMRMSDSFGYKTIPEVLIKIHLHDGPQLTDPTPKKAEALKRFIAKHQEHLSQTPQKWILAHRTLAELYYQTGYKAEGRKVMQTLLKTNFFRLKSWKSLLLFELFGTEQLGLRQRLSNLKTANYRSINSTETKNRSREGRNSP
ncbi:MAG: glycosyltransferase family 2 protein [Anaerolineae bacterium]|nr:glycosyltransferase family 2 protein [Anaerolineae bacterium]